MSFTVEEITATMKRLGLDEEFETEFWKREVYLRQWAKDYLEHPEKYRDLFKVNEGKE
jgi:hypothetical protein